MTSKSMSLDSRSSGLIFRLMIGHAVLGRSPGKPRVQPAPPGGPVGNVAPAMTYATWRTRTVHRNFSPPVRRQPYKGGAGVVTPGRRHSDGALNDHRPGDRCR